jgi:hypothetical protein
MAEPFFNNSIITISILKILVLSQIYCSRLVHFLRFIKQLIQGWFKKQESQSLDRAGISEFASLDMGDDRAIQFYRFDPVAICRSISQGRVVFFHSDGNEGDLMYEIAPIDVPDRVRQVYAMLHHPSTRNNLFRSQRNNGLSSLVIRGLSRQPDDGSFMGTNAWMNLTEIAATTMDSHLFQNCEGAKEVLMRLIDECIIGTAIPVIANYIPFDEESNCHCLFIIQNENYGENN